MEVYIRDLNISIREILLLISGYRTVAGYKNQLKISNQYLSLHTKLKSGWIMSLNLKLDTKLIEEKIEYTLEYTVKGDNFLKRMAVKY